MREGRDNILFRYKLVYEYLPFFFIENKCKNDLQSSCSRKTHNTQVLRKSNVCFVCIYILEKLKVYLFLYSGPFLGIRARYFSPKLIHSHVIVFLVVVRDWSYVMRLCLRPPYALFLFLGTMRTNFTLFGLNIFLFGNIYRYKDNTQALFVCDWLYYIVYEGLFLK